MTRCLAVYTAVLLIAGCAGTQSSQGDASFPRITPSFPALAPADQPIPVSATIIGKSRSTKATLFYQGRGDDRFFPAPPPSVSRNTYTWSLPSKKDAGTLAFYIHAGDGQNSTRHPAKGEHLIRIILSRETGIALIKDVLDYPLYEVIYSESTYPNLAGKDIYADFYIVSKDLRRIQAVITFAKDKEILKQMERDRSFCEAEYIPYLLIDYTQTKESLKTKTREFFEGLR